MGGGGDVGDIKTKDKEKPQTGVVVLTGWEGERKEDTGRRQKGDRGTYGGGRDNPLSTRPRPPAHRRSRPSPDVDSVLQSVRHYGGRRRGPRDHEDN